MKKLIFTFILLSLTSVYGQTADKETLKQLNENVISSYKAGKLDDALKYAQQTIEMTSKIYGIEHVETAAAFSNLGIIQREKNKFKESVGSLQKALEIFQKNERLNGKELAEAYESIAFSQSRGGMKKNAEANYLKAIEVAEKTFGKESKEILKPTVALAIFYVQRDEDSDIERSWDYYLRSYALAIKHFGKESSEVEAIQIYESYYSKQIIWKNDERYKNYKKKVFELFGCEAGEAVSLPKPKYPSEAKSQEKQGRIVVKVWINEQGEVTDAKAVCGEMLFASAGEKAASEAKFKPSTVNGKPIGIVGFITYKFVKA